MSLRLRPRVLLGLIVVVAAAAWIANSLLVSAQPQERTVLRQAPLSCAELIAASGLEGEEVHCKEPPPPTTEEPRAHGPYRLVPAGYVGPLSYEYDGPTEPEAGVITNDISVLQASSLYKAPSYVPEGYALRSMDTFDGDSETIIRAVYSGPGDPIEVFRVRRYERPIDVNLPPPDALRVMEATTLDGRPAILSYPEPGSILEGHSFTRVSFVDGYIETTVIGHGLDLENAMRIAQSLQLVGDRAVVEPKGAAVVEPETVPPALAEGHVIVAGIMADSLAVTDWWHGGDYGHKALDLQMPLPGGGPATIDAQVAYQSVAYWPGPNGLRATVVYYSGNCTGVKIMLEDAGSNVLGYLSYVHISSPLPEGWDWTVQGGGTTGASLGTVLDWEDEKPDCDIDGTHLHQAIDTGYPHTGVNEEIPGVQEGLQQFLIDAGHPNVIEPRLDWDDQWVLNAQTIDADGDTLTDEDEYYIYHTDMYRPDTDGDGCSEGEEIGAQPGPWRHPQPAQILGLLRRARAHAPQRRFHVEQEQGHQHHR